MRQLPIFLCDYYKLCHADQYDERINKLVSYSTPRGCRLPGKDYVINFGIQAFCKKYLIDAYNKEFFRVPANEVERITWSFLTNTLPGIDVEKSVERIMKLHKLGYLPISIRTLPEGSKVSLKCPNVELVTTHPDFPWIGGYIESLFSSDSWKPMLDATVGHWYRETANKYYEMTSDNWQSKARSAMSEFGFRGADSPESGIGSGAAWLLSFNKTATCSAIPYINKYYNTCLPDEVVDITEYVGKYHEELLKNCDEEKLGDELGSFMRDTESWHSTSCVDKETGKYVTVIPLGCNKLPDWLMPRESWYSGKKFSINDSMLVVKEGKDNWTTIPFDIDVVGQGLISTEHSVMCSGVSLEMENILKGRTDITNKLNKSFINDNGFERDCLGSLSLFIDNHINDENFDDVVKDLEFNYYIKNPDTQEVFIIKYVMTDEDYKIKDGKKSQIMKFLSPCNLINIQKEAEKNVVKRLLIEVYPHSSFSMVSDSYDYWRLVTEILPELKDVILRRYSYNSFYLDITNNINRRYSLMKSLEENKEVTDDQIRNVAVLKECYESLRDTNIKLVEYTDLDGRCWEARRNDKWNEKNRDIEDSIDIIKLTKRNSFPSCKPATLFVRGDSGDPVKIVAGYIDVTDLSLPEEEELDKRISIAKKCLNTISKGEFNKDCEIKREVDRLVRHTNMTITLSDRYSDVCNKIINDCSYLKSLINKSEINDNDWDFLGGTDFKLKAEHNNLSKEFCYYRKQGKYYKVSDDSEIPPYVAKGTVEVLWDIFGGTVNSKGYKVLDPHIRAIYGDSITQQRQEMIYKVLEMKGFSVENVALGAGSFSFHAYEKDGVLYPYTRDTMNYCMKNTYAEYSKEVKSTATGNGLPSRSGIYGNSYTHTSIDRYQESVMVYKDPKTDNENFKRSQRGCCAVYKCKDDENKYYLDHDGLTLKERESDTDIAFEEIFRDGKMIKEVTFKEVREVLNEGKF